MIPTPVRSTLRRASLTVLGGACLALTAFGAAAQDYPNRAVRIIVPFAPGRLSMMKFWPIVSCSRCAMKRPKTSADPPGANGTMLRTARFG